ncbi:hypothetical protein N2152v2_005036 [Parachlorella kessleri]
MSTGFFQRIRFWGSGGISDAVEEAFAGPRTNPWQEVFDPNTNQNMKKTGRSHFDTGKPTLDPAKKEPSCWEYVVQSQEKAAKSVKEKAFESMGGSKDSPVDAADLKKLFDPEHVDSIMKMADKNGDGKIDFKEFCDM